MSIFFKERRVMKKIVTVLCCLFLLNGLSYGATDLWPLHYWDFDGADQAADKVGDLTSGTEGTPDYDVDYGAPYTGAGDALQQTYQVYGNYVTAGDSGSDIDFGTGDFSISFWYYGVNDTDTRQMRVLDCRNGSGSGIIIGTTYTDINVALVDDNGNQAIGNVILGANNIGLFPEGWSHVSITVDRNDKASVYVNGTPNHAFDVSNLTGNIVGSELLQIGVINGGDQDADVQSGAIDDLAFYHGVLTSADIADLYNHTLTPEDMFRTNSAYNPIPSDGATGVAVSQQLSWDPPTEYTPESYDIYLVTGEPNFVGVTPVNQSGNTYSPSLVQTTTYYWKVDAYEPNAVPILHEGEVWSFTTVDPTPVIETHPVSQTVAAGENVTFSVDGQNLTTFQWYHKTFGGTVTPLGTNQIQDVTGVALADEGYYYCVANGLLSDSARLMTERLVAHWAFENNLEDSEGTYDATYVDPNEANPVPTPTFVAGRLGQALSKTDGTLYAQVVDSNDFFNFFPQGFTASGWVKLDDVTRYNHIVRKDDFPTQNGWTHQVYNSTPRLIVRDGTGVDVTTGTAVENDTWYHVVSTYEPGARYAVYVNGRLVVEDTTGVSTSIPGSASDIVLGQSLLGLLDEVKIWTYPLAEKEVLQEYVNVTGVPECFGELLYDFSGPEGTPDCVVDVYDLAEFASHWLDNDLIS